MSLIFALLLAVLALVGATVYFSVAVLVMVVVRRRVMEVTCRADERKPGPGYSDHLYCPGTTSHWGGPIWAGVLWPVALVPLLILARLHRDQVSQSRIDRLERELGMRR